jgi:HEAT repeat protein
MEGMPPAPTTGSEAPEIPPPIPGPTTPTPPGLTPAPLGPVGRPVSPSAARIGARGGRVATTDEESSWQHWWALNRLALLPDRDAARARRAVTPGEEAAEDPTGATAFTRGRVVRARDHVIPFLLRVVDPRERMRDDVVASALLALGKLSQDRETIPLLVGRLEDPRSSAMVRESAALALGLLRRTEASLQVTGRDLDRVRAALFVRFDDEEVPARARAFAALSLGLLGDQPFGDAYSRDGRLVVQGLWARLHENHAHRDAYVALLAALGMQPGAGLPDGVREGLYAIVAGRRVQGRKWPALERGHALAAAMRLGGPGSTALLLRVLGRKREDEAVRRAAFVALGPTADRATPDERADLARALSAALPEAHDPLTRGLGHVAAGRLLAADVAAGSDRLVRESGLARVLLAEARSGATPTRGFSTLALALALRGAERAEAPLSDACRAFRAEGVALLLARHETGHGDAGERSAVAVALGLAAVVEAVEPLRRAVEDRNADPALRGHAAVALGHLGVATPEVERALHLALAERRDDDLRRQAALGLAFLGGRAAVVQLLRELEAGRSERHLAQVVIALGRLGELDAVEPLLRHAADGARSESGQALAVVALGLIADPETRPSLLRLTEDANYPGRTDAMHEAYSIL